MNPKLKFEKYGRKSKRIVYNKHYRISQENVFKMKELQEHFKELNISLSENRIVAIGLYYLFNNVTDVVEMKELYKKTAIDV